MAVSNHMKQFSCLHITYLCDHHKQNCILADIPVICCKNILRTLIEDCIQCQFLISRCLSYIKCHRVCTWIQVHLVKILMHINICHNSTAEWIVFQIIDNSVYLIHHAFFILMFHSKLISVCFTDRTIFICPAIPDMAVKIMDVIGFLLPDPENLIHSTLQRSTSKRHGRKFFSKVISVYHTKFLNCVGRCSVLPHRADLLSFCARTILQDILAHFYKYIICVTHYFLLSRFLIFYILLLYKYVPLFSYYS